MFYWVARGCFSIWAPNFEPWLISSYNGTVVLEPGSDQLPVVALKHVRRQVTFCCAAECAANKIDCGHGEQGMETAEGKFLPKVTQVVFFQK